MHPGRGYNELKVGDVFESTMTLTETHIVLGAGLFGDFNPLHVNESYGKETRFGGRIAHGYLTSNVMAAPMGMILYGTAIAYVEHNIKFTAPVRAGDTLTVAWTVSGHGRQAQAQRRHGRLCRHLQEPGRHHGRRGQRQAAGGKQRLSVRGFSAPYKVVGDEFEEIVLVLDRDAEFHQHLIAELRATSGRRPGQAMVEMDRQLQDGH